MIEKTCEGQRLLEIDNLHNAKCGPPPSLNVADRYVGYFENGCGEQWVFIGDRKTGKAVIRGGDAGWQTEFNVSLSKPCPTDLVLGEEEKQWIITCFMAMSNAPYDVVAAAFAAGDFADALLGMVLALSGGPTVEPADHEDKNAANGDHRKYERSGK